jgi:hypothetical protein
LQVHRDAALFTAADVRVDGQSAETCLGHLHFVPAKIELQYGELAL